MTSDTYDIESEPIIQYIQFGDLLYDIGIQKYSQSPQISGWSVSKPCIPAGLSQITVRQIVQIKKFLTHKRPTLPLHESPLYEACRIPIHHFIGT